MTGNLTTMNTSPNPKRQPLLEHTNAPCYQKSNVPTRPPTVKRKPTATPKLPAPLLGAVVALALAAPLPLLPPGPEGDPELDVLEPVNVTLESETEKDCEVSVRVIPVPLTQRLEIPAAP